MGRGVARRRQVWAGVISVGPTGQTLESSYRNRDSPAYQREMGAAVLAFAGIVPDGVLVFFPSYAVLMGCLEAWKRPDPAGGPSLWCPPARRSPAPCPPASAGVQGLGLNPQPFDPFAGAADLQRGLQKSRGRSALKRADPWEREAGIGKGKREKGTGKGKGVRGSGKGVLKPGSYQFIPVYTRCRVPVQYPYGSLTLRPLNFTLPPPPLE